MAKCTCQAKVDTGKANLREALFGPVLKRAFVTQGGGRAMAIEEMDIVIQESRNVVGMGQIEVKIEFFLHPAIQSLYNGIVRGSSPSRHRTKYVIIVVGLAKSPRRVDSSLVGV